MKITAILGSPRINGNSATVAKRFVAKGKELGAESSIFELNRMTYRGCQGCYACKKSLEQCVLNDDLAEALNSVRGSDILILASPVYYGDVTAQMKGFIDRSYSFLKPDYMTSRTPSRLSDKKIVFILTQGHVDKTFFADIYPRYSGFYKWMGFEESTLIRACGIGPATVDEVSEDILLEADEAASRLCGISGDR